MNPTVPLLVFGCVLPSVLAGVVVLLARRRLPDAVVGALAVGAGYLAGHFGLRGWRGWAPRESTDWIAVVALIGLVAGVSGLTRRGPAGVRSVARLLLAWVVTWLLVGRLLLRGHGAFGAARDTLMLAAGIAVAWSAIDSLATPLVRGGPLLLLLLFAVGGAVVLGLSGTVLLAQLSGVLAFALGAVLVVAWMGGARRPCPDLLAGVAPPTMLVLGALLLAGFYYAGVPRTALLCMAAAPLAALLVRQASGLRSARTGRSADGAGTLAVQLLVVAGLVGGAIGLAIDASPPFDSEGY